ncbi:MAG: sialidase family protein [Armatimonadota bacterium]|nr:sialidase family protein [Armatimonadota bacterium]
MASISGLTHGMAFEYNGLLYVIGYRAGGQYLRRSADGGETWLPFADEAEEKLVAMPSDEQRVAFVKMATQGRALVVGVPNFPEIDVYVSHDDGESWTQEPAS